MISKASFDVSIVFPCFQEELSIEEGVRAVFETMRAESKIFEVILVDDASTDKTREKIINISKEYPDIKYLFQDINTGRGKAFLNGSALAEGKIVGYIDVDMEVSISSLPEVIREIEKGQDLVLVRRNYNLKWSLGFIVRHFASSIYKSMVQFFLKIPKLDTESGFKFFKKESLLALKEKVESDRWFFDTEIVCLAYFSGMRVAQVEGEYKKNSKKTSTVHLLSDSLLQFSKLIAFRKKLKHLFPK